MNSELISIELPTKVVQLRLTPFDTDINADDITQIQYHNIMGEILTSSVLMNRIGNLQAEMENLVNETKLDFEIFYAQTEEKVRKELTFNTVDSKGKAKTERPSIPEIEQAIIRKPEYKVKKKHLFEVQRNAAYVNSLYWALKDKCDKVNKLSDKLRPEEFEKDILEESINGVVIKVREKLLK